MTSELIAMRRKGLPNAEIAASLGVPLRAIETQVGKLIHAGTLRSRRGLLWSHPDSWAEGRERRPDDVASAVARLYGGGKQYKEIAAELDLTTAQVHNLLVVQFAAGLPKRPRRSLSDEQARAIHAAHLNGASIDVLAGEIGFSGTAVRNRLHRLNLPIHRVPRR